MSKPVRQGNTVFLSSIVRSQHHFSIENLLKALKSALETKQKKTPTSHWQQDPLTPPQMGWGRGGQTAGPQWGKGEVPWRAKPVKINAHTKTKARAYKAQPGLSGSDYLAPPFRGPAAPGGLHKGCLNSHSLSHLPPTYLVPYLFKVKFKPTSIFLSSS